jgi:hypothetical protein
MAMIERRNVAWRDMHSGESNIMADYIVSYEASLQTFVFSYERLSWRDGMPSLHRAAFDARTGECVWQGQDSFAKPTPEEMQTWQAHAALLVERWSGRLSDLAAVQYIRFGDLPKDGRSKNHVTGQLEHGVSVYCGRYNLDTGAIVFEERTSVHNPGTLVFVMERPAYLVTGKYIGVGSDGEPLLQQVRIISRLSYDPIKGGFLREIL